MSISLVQQTAVAQGASVTTLQTAAFGSAVTTGNSILVGIVGYSGNASSTIAITDTRGNTYTCSVFSTTSGLITNPATTANGFGAFVGFWIVQNATGGSSFKVTATVTTSGAGDYLNMIALEVSGITSSTPDTKNGTNGTTDPAKAGALTTTNAADLILVGFSDDDGGTITQSTPSGFNSLFAENDGSTYEIGGMAYEIVSTTQTGINPSFGTSGCTGWAGCGVAYKGASGGSTGGITFQNSVLTPMFNRNVSLYVPNLPF